MDANWLNFIWEVAAVVFAAGAVWNELKAIRKDIARLEVKQDKYNTLQERTRILEVKLENHLSEGKTNVYATSSRID